MASVALHSLSRSQLLVSDLFGGKVGKQKERNIEVKVCLKKLKMRSLLLFVLVAGLVSVWAEEVREDLEEDGRKGRLFSLSLFNVVVIQNSPCVGTNNENGICVANRECTGGNANKIGNCAAGLAACCQFTASECGSSVSRNCSYIQSPTFPQAFTTAGVCKYTIHPASSNICFLRLDFLASTVAGPDLTATGDGDCTIDSIQFTQASGIPVPTICGVNTNQHMYLDAQGTEPICITHTLTGTNVDRFFRYKVSQIECGSLSAPPNDCLQYFTGISGNIQSFNFQGNPPYHLNNQFYTNCIRQEEGRCRIQYTPATGDTNSFQLSLGAGADKALNGNNCGSDYILIPQGRNIAGDVDDCTSNKAGVVSSGATSDQFCGANLNCIFQEQSSTTIVSEAGAPFNVQVYTTGQDINLPNDNVGFSLNYLQLPC